MNTLIRILFVLGLILAATSAAQSTPPAGLERLRIKSQEAPLFPDELVRLGFREGEVAIAFSVDVEGRVEDALAIAYTHPEFARVTLAAVRKWTFEPARLAGRRIATASEVSVHFEVHGTVVVSMTSGEAFASAMAKMHAMDDTYYPRALRELDRIPTPLEAPSPGYPTKLAELGHTGDVVVNFYIDESGAVRLPAVDADNDPELSALAIQAIQSWKFEPPVCRGRKVLTKTSQVFRFRPLPATGRTAKN